MKTFISYSAFVILLNLFFHQGYTQQLQWHRDFNLGTHAGTYINRDMAYDASGNLYVVGSFMGNVNFGDGINRIASGIDFFFVKYNSVGSLTSFQKIGLTNAKVEPKGISLITQNGTVFLYVSGIFTSTNGQILTVNFNPNGNTPLTMNDLNGDAFVAKYNMNTGGSCVWATRINNTNANLIGGKVAVDTSGDVFYASSINSNPAGVATLNKFNGTTGVQAFSVNISTSGTVNDIGVRGTSVFVCGKGLSSSNKPLAWFNKTNGIFQSGSGNSTSLFEDLTLDAGTGIYIIRSGYGAEKYTSSAGSISPIWSQSISGWQYFSDIALTGPSQSEVVVAMRFSGTYTYSGGTLISSLNGSDQDILALRINASNGLTIWAGLNSNAPGTGSSAFYVYPLMIAANVNSFSIMGLIETETVDLDFCLGATYVTGGGVGSSATEYIASYITGSGTFTGVISGADMLCEAMPALFTLQNVAPGSTVSWSVNPSYLVTVSTGNGYSFNTAASGVSTGTITITAQVSFNCGVGGSVTKNVWVGIPENLCPPSYTLEPCETLYLSTCSSASVKSYNWYMDGDWVATTFTENYFYIATILQQGQHSVCVEGQNDCGVSISRSCSTFYSSGCGMGFQSIAKGYPNPVTNTLNFNLESSENKSLPYEYSYQLIDKNGTKVKSEMTNQNSLAIDVSTLPRGDYYFKVFLPQNNRIEQKIIIQ
ncbi:MAG: hypothetical protein RI909_1008 [Bacteroidota bacterium]|jgi:hypothetical protein